MLRDQPHGWVPGDNYDASCGDADTVAARAEDLGGSVVAAPMDTRYGRFATLSDPAGAQFKLREQTPRYATRRAFPGRTISGSTAGSAAERAPASRSRAAPGDVGAYRGTMRRRITGRGHHAGLRQGRGARAPPRFRARREHRGALPGRAPLHNPLDSRRFAEVDPPGMVEAPAVPGGQALEPRTPAKVSRLTEAERQFAGEHRDLRIP